jgi:hypothetical protein
MAVSSWIAGNWFNLFQTVGIVGGLLFTAYALRRDEKARKVGNMITINQEHHEIWKELYERPALSRVLDKAANVNRDPISDAEGLFVNSLILHLSTVHRAIEDGVFVPLEGLREDIREFFSLPIPQAMWKRNRKFQNRDFAEFVESCQAEH